MGKIALEEHVLHTSVQRRVALCFEAQEKRRRQ